jgi:hypothetical protein
MKIIVEEKMGAPKSHLEAHFNGRMWEVLWITKSPSYKTVIVGSIEINKYIYFYGWKLKIDSLCSSGVWL